jgi:drug/metabolite transporter (DMT)-like permease
MPIGAIILGAIILGEPITWGLMGGTVLVLVGVYIGAFARPGTG